MRSRLRGQEDWLLVLPQAFTSMLLSKTPSNRCENWGPGHVSDSRSQELVSCKSGWMTKQFCPGLSWLSTESAASQGLISTEQIETDSWSSQCQCQETQCSSQDCTVSHLAPWSHYINAKGPGDLWADLTAGSSLWLTLRSKESTGRGSLELFMPAIRRLRQEDHEFKASLGNI
jgi:hypothetical protein